MDPSFNLREIAKQLILVEDHLLHGYKFCPDCLRKHLLTVEAFAEEATTLDHANLWGDFPERLAEQARQWLEHLADAEDPRVIGQQIRGLRKQLVPLVFDPRSPVQRVAFRFESRRRFCVCAG